MATEGGWKASMEWLDGMTRNETAQDHLRILRAALEAADQRKLEDKQCWDMWQADLRREQVLFARLLKSLGMPVGTLGDALEAACITIETVTEQARAAAQGGGTDG